MLARQVDIGLNIDAAEGDRLEMSLELPEQLCLAVGQLVEAAARFSALDMLTPR